MRGHNAGSIYQRPDGHKVAAVSMPGGKRATRLCPHRHRPEDRDKECPEAKRLLRDLKALRDEGRGDGATMRLGPFLRRWLSDVRGSVAPATWSKWEQHVRLHLTPALGSHRMSDLRVAHVDAYIRAGTLDAQTLRHHRATLRRALRDAQRDGYVRVNVAGLSKPPKLTPRERTVLTADQAKALLASLAAQHDGPCAEDCQLPHRDRLYALWVLLVTTGMREAEALGLTWDALDLDAGTAIVSQTLHRIDGAWQMRDPKTAKSRRTVVLPPITVDALRAHRRAQLEEWIAAGRPGQMGLVFVTTRGTPIHGSRLSAELHLHTDVLGLPRVTAHDLRHSAATMLYAAGMPLELIADTLGHSTVRVTADLYRHRVEERAREAADAMQKALG